jgi:hypothetical protein
VQVLKETYPGKLAAPFIQKILFLAPVSSAGYHHRSDNPEQRVAHVNVASLTVVIYHLSIWDSAAQRRRYRRDSNGFMR